MRRRDLLGPWGEALACEYLRGRGCRIVACNYRSRFGEIDVIAEDRKFLIFAEVKLRKSAEYGASLPPADRLSTLISSKASSMWTARRWMKIMSTNQRIKVIWNTEWDSITRSKCRRGVYL